MPAATPLLPFLSFLSLLFFLSHVSSAASDETQPLLNLKSSLQSSNATLFSTWLPSNSPCNFTGITCNSLSSIVAIELSHQHLTGSLPLDSICQLSSLQRLSLGFNSLSGTISPALNNCINLEHLDLGNNNFSGSFPDISSLHKLQYLYLNMSGFSGTFPWNSLTNMTNLLVLSLGDNGFDITPFPHQVVGLKHLYWLYLSNCSISGTIPPEIGNLTRLIRLELAENYLTGRIPPEISQLKNLWMLELHHNSLTGTLPAGLGNLTSLQCFDASNNSLEGDLSELRSLTKLVSLQLFFNGFSGEVPAEFGEFKNLVNLSLYSNNLKGQLPQKLGSWAQFNFIDVSTNNLSGPIPPDMCKQGTMKKLLILQNSFSGEIPAKYANCSTLTRFRVSQNSLSGVVPGEIWGLPNVDIIDIAYNEFEGSITSDIANAGQLSQLWASNNKLSGHLPVEISNASSLVSVDLSSNQLTGQIPTNIGQLKQLSSLHLQTNQFYGDIPVSLGSCLHLSDLNLAYNSFSGEIPLSFGSFPALNALNLSNNQLSGQIPNTLSSLRLSLFDLSHNRLSGPIPESLYIEAQNGSFAGNSGLCSSNLKSFHPCSSHSHDVRTFIICFLLGLAAFVALIAFYVRMKRRYQKDHTRSLKHDCSWDMKSYHVLSFTEDEIIDSIKQENLIGKGGSGSVYKVSLRDGQELAVKHIWNSGSGDGKMSKPSTPMLSKQSAKRCQEFDSEVQTLSSIRHVNVVKLYCSITSEDSSLLVYEYMANGSLWDRLHSCNMLRLDWQTRYEIAVGAAKGLEYLHHGCEKPVIHRDVKSSNILLDEFLKPRIADFGLAKIVQDTGGRHSTNVIPGTLGYIAPEYGYTLKVNEKSDVYSFGVVLMELVSGKRPIEPEFGENRDIACWVWSNLKKRERVLRMVDSSIPEPLKEDAIKVLRIAILCTQKLPEVRPTMRAVVQMLEDANPCKLVSVVVSREGSRKKEENPLKY
ncbi:Receptor-like protein kinase 7 [Ancistrocladus abbreviatus]